MFFSHNYVIVPHTFLLFLYANIVNTKSFQNVGASKTPASMQLILQHHACYFCDIKIDTPWSYLKNFTYVTITNHFSLYINTKIRNAKDLVVNHFFLFQNQ